MALTVIFDVKRDGADAIRNLACVRRRCSDMGYRVRSYMNGAGSHERGKWMSRRLPATLSSICCFRDRADSRSHYRTQPVEVVSANDRDVDVKALLRILRGLETLR